MHHLPPQQRWDRVWQSILNKSSGASPDDVSILRSRLLLAGPLVDSCRAARLRTCGGLSCFCCHGLMSGRTAALIFPLASGPCEKGARLRFPECSVSAACPTPLTLHRACTFVVHCSCAWLYVRPNFVSLQVRQQRRDGRQRPAVHLWRRKWLYSVQYAVGDTHSSRTNLSDVGVSRRLHRRQHHRKLWSSRRSKSINVFFHVLPALACDWYVCANIITAAKVSHAPCRPGVW